MEKLDGGQLAKIQKQWEKFREEQLLRRLLLRFQTFLQNQTVSNTVLFCMKTRRVLMKKYYDFIVFFVSSIKAYLLRCSRRIYATANQLSERLHVE